MEENKTNELEERRRFLTRMWQFGGGLVAAAGAWTTWDLLQPLPTAGFGGKVRTLPPESIPETGVVEVSLGPGLPDQDQR